MGPNLPGRWDVVVDGNDNFWISNFAASDGKITQLCGTRTENCPPGFKTGDPISPPGGYVGGGLQMQTGMANAVVLLAALALLVSVPSLRGCTSFS
jgi:hypothetical protein